MPQVFKRADALAIAMEARGYKGGEGRTRYRTLQWGVKDTLALLVILCLMLIVFLSKKMDRASCIGSKIRKKRYTKRFLH